MVCREYEQGRFRSLNFKRKDMIMENLLVYKEKFQGIDAMFNLNQNINVIAGPCSIESYEQMDRVAKTLVENDIRFIRGGAFKPRTSPYSFQGLGLEGLKIIDEIRNKYSLLAISEIMDTKDIELGLKYTDIIQIGSRNMENYQLLKEIGKTKHPVLLKRGYMATLNEFLLAAEYILSEGNDQIILCERGIRTFENSTRYTLDISSVAIIMQETTLPLVVDLSHSLGRTDIMPVITKGLLEMGVSSLMFEVHPNPSCAYSDNNQQLNIDAFLDIVKMIKRKEAISHKEVSI